METAFQLALLALLALLVFSSSLVAAAELWVGRWTLALAVDLGQAHINVQSRDDLAECLQYNGHISTSIPSCFDPGDQIFLFVPYVI